MFQELKKDRFELCLHIVGWMYFTGYVGYAFDIYPFRKLYDDYFVTKTTTIVIEYVDANDSSTNRETNYVTTEQ